MSWPSILSAFNGDTHHCIPNNEIIEEQIKTTIIAVLDRKADVHHHTDGCIAPPKALRRRWASGGRGTRRAAVCHVESQLFFVDLSPNCSKCLVVVHVKGVYYSAWSFSTFLTFSGSPECRIQCNRYANTRWQLAFHDGRTLAALDRTSRTLSLSCPCLKLLIYFVTHPVLPARL